MSKKKTMLSGAIVKNAVKASFIKLDPRVMIRNPIMFVVEIGFLITTFLIFVPDAFGGGVSRGFNLTVALILLITVLFANFAEALAEAAAKRKRTRSRKRKKRLWPIS
ncbi:hypothetical protein HMSSN139_12520 [Paenibacillus sp. HMSSN-139]|nr:hypothetical protein HMSSN139_12520 [Paenibacillus sp. HMSSN-139]